MFPAENCVQMVHYLKNVQINLTEQISQLKATEKKANCRRKYNRKFQLTIQILYDEKNLKHSKQILETLLTNFRYL